MTGFRDFHTSVFDFATKVMTAVESQRGSQRLHSTGMASTGTSLFRTTDLYSPIRLEAVIRAIKASSEKDSVKTRVQGENKCHRERAGPYPDRNAYLASTLGISPNIKEYTMTKVIGITNYIEFGGDNNAMKNFMSKENIQFYDESWSPLDGIDPEVAHLVTFKRFNPAPVKHLLMARNARKNLRYSETRDIITTDIPRNYDNRYAVGMCIKIGKANQCWMAFNFTTLRKAPLDGVQRLSLAHPDLQVTDRYLGEGLRTVGIATYVGGEVEDKEVRNKVEYDSFFMYLRAVKFLNVLGSGDELPAHEVDDQEVSDAELHTQFCLK